ncbi:MAG: glycosyltransferase [Oscillospiraceae bacterium]|nr:glycosyltransferase [Oscillospiraceae bacterium]
MRIALFSETYFPEVNGVVSHVKVLKEGLERLGHQVLVVTTDVGAHKHYVRNGVLYCPGKKIKKVYGYGAAMPMNTKRYKYLKEFNPDIIHIHTEFGIGLFGLFTAKLLKKPIVYTLHTVYDEYLYYLIPKVLTQAGRQIFYKYIKKIADNADLIIGPSKKSEEFLKRAGVRKKLEIIANGVDTNKFSPWSVTLKDRNEIRNIYKIPKDAFVGATITRLGKEKSIDVLIKYIKKYIQKNNNFYLMIVGDGPAKSSLKELVNQLGLENNIIFTGKILNKDIIPYYGASDVFMTASLTEINSISMLEAMSMGLPVLQRYDEVNKDQIIEGVNGFTFSDNDSMIECLDKIINLSLEEKINLKRTVRESVIDQGSVNVAENILKKYLILSKKNY